MIQIKQSLLRNLERISKEHYIGIKPYIEARLKLLKNRQIDFITRHLQTILTAKPKELIGINDDYETFCTKAGRGKLININRRLSTVFNYKWFSKKEATYYCGYNLAEKLNVKTCPYCNRNYTVTVAQGKDRTVRPDFDHFFPKNEYPLLSLSFYNLIPSCSVCNRTIKNQAKIIYGKYAHPYEEGFDSALKINYFPKDLDSSLGIKGNFGVLPVLSSMEPTKATRCGNSFALFKLREIYEASHNGEIADLIRKHVVSNGRYLEILNDAFPRLGGIEELYRLGFGNFYFEDDFEKRPLSKMTKDIVEQLTFTFPGLSVLK